jgi:ABC-type branched-subunit amino acid transport system ATPase component/ABC-type branched-subunit amino acid transport system permease subunit
VVESRQIAAAQGIAPNMIATANWMLGSMLAVVAAILIVNVSGLSVLGLTMLVIPALAAALLGGFRSFPLTLLGGLLIGILQSEVGWLQTYLTQHAGHPVTLEGWAETVPFLVIIAVLVIGGRALPLRGELTERPPRVGEARVGAFAWLATAGAIVLTSVVLSPSLVQAAETTAALGVILLSLVVVTGLAGQLSLAQFALAGFGAWIAALLVARAGVSFAVAALAGVAATVPLGIVVGLPSLRARGINLAVATLGLALVIEAQVFAVGSRTGGLLGFDLHGSRLLGIDIDATTHPRRYATLSLVVFALACVVVRNVRRGRVGRRLLAVRSNERAAASLGISVFGAKLYAFGLGAALAAIGGILICFQQQRAVFFPTFTSLQSIFAVVYAVIGGVGFILGAVIGAVAAPTGVGTVALGDVIHPLQTSYIVQLILAAGLLVVLWRYPDGLASRRPFGKRRGKPSLRRRTDRRPETLPELGGEPVAPTTLELHSVGVRYGGVVALEGVSLSVTPGRVTGLIGPNGAGKTTLIDAVSGFTRARGQVTLNGVSLTGWSPRRRARSGIGRSFQSLELFETMTVRENLRTAADRRDRLGYLLGLLRVDRAPLSVAAVAAVRELGLEGDLDLRPDQLSHGRRRLVAIARALAARPSVLLLDEPAAGLDELETKELGRLLRRLADEWRLAVLLVEHDVSLVMRVCDEVVVLDRGRHLRTGTPGEVGRDPRVIEAYLGSTTTTAVEEQPGAPTTSLTARTARRGDAEVLIAARRLVAGYGDLVAVRDLDLIVRRGEVVALLGPNGAGKTTTMLTLAGELAPLGGSADVLGLPHRSPLYRRARAGLRLVPEDRGVINGLTCAENLRISSGEMTDAVSLFPELEPLLGQLAGRLSGGEQKMVSLSRALASKPRLLLLDELSLGLAPAIVERLLSEVRRAADQGVGVLLVEQHAPAALRIADRAVVMRRGRIELSGTADELRGQLAHVETAYLTGVETGQGDRALSSTRSVG